MNFLLSISADQYGESIIKTAGFGETLAFGAMIVFIGMLTVFAVLILLWFSLVLFKKAFHDIPEKRKSTPINEKIPVQETVQNTTDDENEIVAVLAAAIAMAESNNDDVKFRVVSFKKK